LASEHEVLLAVGIHEIPLLNQLPVFLLQLWFPAHLNIALLHGHNTIQHIICRVLQESLTRQQVSKVVLAAEAAFVMIEERAMRKETVHDQQSVSGASWSQRI
jgi:hypothetical protein